VRRPETAENQQMSTGAACDRLRQGNDLRSAARSARRPPAPIAGTWRLFGTKKEQFKRLASRERRGERGGTMETSRTRTTRRRAACACGAERFSVVRDCTSCPPRLRALRVESHLRQPGQRLAEKRVGLAERHRAPYLARGIEALARLGADRLALG